MQQYKKQVKPFKMILYGDAGSGKTTFAASIAKYPEHFGRVLWLNAAGNPQIIYDESNLSIFNLEDISDMTEPTDWIETGQKANHVMVKKYGLEAGGVYNTVVLDCITEVQNLVFEKLLPTKKMGEMPTKASFNHWGTLLKVMTKIGKGLFDEYETNVIVTAWEQYDEKKEQFNLDLSGKSYGIFPGYAPLVCRIIKTREFKAVKLKGSRALLIDTVNSYTKNQLIKDPTLPNYIDDDPDIMSLYKYYLSSITSES